MKWNGQKINCTFFNHCKYCLEELRELRFQWKSKECDPGIQTRDGKTNH